MYTNTLIIGAINLKMFNIIHTDYDDVYIVVEIDRIKL